MRILYSSFFLLILSTNDFFSNENKDSLLKLIRTYKFNLQKSIQDTIYFNACLQLGKIYLNTQIDSALYFHNLALKIALNLKNDNQQKWRIAEALRLKGWDYYIKGNYKISEKMIGYALNFTKKIILESPDTSYSNMQAKRISGLSYLYLGMIYKEKSDYGRALDNFFQSYKIFESTNNTKGMANCLGNIGMVYFDQMDYKRALDTYKKTYDLFVETNNKKGQASVIGNMGIVYRNLKKHAEALDCYLKALKIYSNLNDLQGISSAYCNIGIICKENKDYDKALEFYFRAQELDVKLGNYQGQAINFGNIGRVYLFQKKFNSAEKYFKKAIQINNQLGNLFYTESDYEGLSEVCFHKNDYKNALIYYKKHIETRDSIYSERNKKASLVKEMQFNYEKEKAINEAEFSKKLAIAKAEKEKEKFISNFVTAGFVLILTFFIFMTNRLYVIRKRKNIIENQKKIMENQKLKLSEQKKILEEKNKDLTDSINYSKRIQTAVLPSIKKWKTVFPESFVIYLPKEIISGDFYWMEMVGSRIYFAVADCTKHGVPGALISFICSGALSEAVLEMKIKSIEKILTRANEIIRKKLSNDVNYDDGMNICMVCWDKSNQLIEIGCAGIPFYYISNSLTEIKPDPITIGLNQISNNVTIHKLSTEIIKYVYISTDGYYLQSSFGNSDIVYGKKEFENLISLCSQMPVHEQENFLISTISNWKKNSVQTDDLTLLGIKFT
jgi:tetratricopeptide (TPR) repeat protein